MQRKNTLLPLARFTWLILAGLALVVQLVSLRAGLEATYYDPQLASSFTALPGWLSYEAFVLLVLCLRSLAWLACWLAAVFIFWTVGRRESELAPPALVTALVLALFPQLLFYTGMEPGSGLAQPWQPVWSAGVQLFTVLALLALVLLYYIFPDGRPPAVWMGRAAWFFMVGVPAIYLSSMAGLSDSEWFWMAFLLMLLGAFVTGVASQTYRYFRLANPEGRRQTKWVILTLALMPLVVLMSSLSYSSTQLALVGLLLLTLWSIFLPLTLLAAVLYQGLWKVEVPARKKQQYARGAVILALAFMLALGLAFRVEASRAGIPLALGPLPASENPRPVIIDTDMAPDDWIAILYLLQRPDVQVLAITVVGTGEAHCQPGVRNALRLVALSGNRDIPVACGRSTPLQGEQEFPPAWREQSDNLAGLQLPEGRNPAPEATATSLLHLIPLDAPGKVTLVTLGPLTNLAEAIQENPDFLARVDHIYIMGGALEVLGNVGMSGVGIDNQVAEWNIFVDPLALQIVLASGVPVTLVPLDATNQVPARLEFFRRLEANRRTPEARFVYDVLASQLDFIASGGYSFWDPLTAAIFVDENIGYIKEGQVKIFVRPGPSSGLTRLMPGGSPIRYARSVDASRFEDELLRTLNQP